MPPSASSKRPLRSRIAPVNAPLTWPNSSLSRTPSASAAQCTGTRSLAGASALPVQGEGGQLLPGPAFAEDEHGRVGRTDAADRVEEFQHAGVRTHDPMEAGLVGRALTDRRDLLEVFEEHDGKLAAVELERGRRDDELDLLSDAVDGHLVDDPGPPGAAAVNARVNEVARLARRARAVAASVEAGDRGAARQELAAAPAEGGAALDPQRPLEVRVRRNDPEVGVEDHDAAWKGGDEVFEKGALPRKLTVGVHRDFPPRPLRSAPTR